MQRIATLLALSLAAQTAGADQPEAVQARQLDKNQYELTVTLAGTTDPSQGLPHVEPKAIELCGALQPRYGKYRFQADEPLVAGGAASLVFTQQVECVAASNSASAPEHEIPPAPETPPTPKDEADVRARTLAYLETKDKGDFDAAFAMFSPGTAAFMTDDNWRTPRAKFNTVAGANPEREVIRITWYDDPPGAPMPGRYAAADYRARYASSAFYCGYVMWLRQADGGYLILREEEGQALPELLAKTTPDQLPDLRVQLGCRD